MILPSGASTYDYSRTAAARGWGAGWPTCSALNGGATAVVTARRSGTKWYQVHQRVAPLLEILVNEIERRGYMFVVGWNWGGSCRAIAGTNRPSNHSWGLALDLNAPNNPYTSSGVHDIPDWAFSIFRAYGFGCGADYNGKQDWMHVEFMGTPSDADAMYFLAQRAFDRLEPGQPPAPAPVPQEDFFMAIPEADQLNMLNMVTALYKDNQIEGQPYGRQAAGFNDVREMSAKVDQVAQALADLKTAKPAPPDEPFYRLVKDTDHPEGPVYAYAPGVFYHVDAQRLGHLRTSGWAGDDILETFNGLVHLIHDEAARSASDPSQIGAVLEIPAPPPPPTPKTYKVQAGDKALSLIGQKLGIDWHKIAELNNIPGPDYPIFIDQVLTLPN